MTGWLDSLQNPVFLLPISVCVVSKRLIPKERVNLFYSKECEEERRMLLKPHLWVKAYGSKLRVHACLCVREMKHACIIVPKVCNTSG